MRTEITFSTSDGVKLNGRLYHELAAPRSRFPAILMADCARAEMRPLRDETASRFAAAGFVVLVHERRRLSASSASTGMAADAADQMRDDRDAITYLGALDFVDVERIGVSDPNEACHQGKAIAALDQRVKYVEPPEAVALPASHSWALSLASQAREMVRSGSRLGALLPSA
jgi:hypothetical protein